METQNENLKFILANQMQSFANIVLETMLDKRFYNESVSEINLDLTGNPITAVCRKELIQVSSSALKNEPWALKVLDSNGHLQSGLLSGSLLNLLGNYDQCLDVSEIAKQQQNLIRGTSYCLAQIDLSKEARQLSLISDQQEAFYNAGRVAKLGLCVPGSCRVSEISSLTNHILSTSLSSMLTVNQVDCYSNESNFTLVNTSTSFVLSLMVLIILLSLSTSATILHSVNFKSRQNKLKIVDRIIDTFSLINGWNRLTRARKSDNQLPPSRLNDCMSLVDGLRVISMFWIIAVHSYNFGIEWLSIENIYRLQDIYKTPWIQWIANGTFSVDNFFLISGLLVTLKHLMVDRRHHGQHMIKRKLSDCCANEKGSGNQITERECAQINRFNFKLELSRIFHLCARRYLRLAPVMMILILFSVGLLPQIAHGPNWRKATIMFNEWCHTGWHLNLLMVQNLVQTPTMCFSHSWFVAVNWQLFLLIQLIFLANHWLTTSTSCHLYSSTSGKTNSFMKFPRIITRKLLFSLKWLHIWSILIAQLMIAITIYHKELVSIPLIPSKTIEAMINYYSLIYIKPHYWLASYSIGCLTAICLRSILSPQQVEGLKERGSRTKIVAKRWLSTALIQFASLALMAVLILSALPYFIASERRMSNLEAAMYAFLSRPLWSLSIATTLILAALHSSLKPNKVNTMTAIATTTATATTTSTNEDCNPVTSFIHFILSGHIWLPFGRLTYSAFLLHPVLMATFYGSRTDTFQFSHWLLLYFVVGNIVLTYAVALVVYLFIEIPIQVTIKRIERHYLIDGQQLIAATGSVLTSIDRPTVAAAITMTTTTTSTITTTTTAKTLTRAHQYNFPI